MGPRLEATPPLSDQPHLATAALVPSVQPGTLSKEFDGLLAWNHQQNGT